jgi:hypothetical protein
LPASSPVNVLIPVMFPPGRFEIESRYPRATPWGWVTRPTMPAARAQDAAGAFFVSAGVLCVAFLRAP